MLIVPESVAGKPPDVMWTFRLPNKRPVNTALLLLAAGTRSAVRTPPSTLASDQVTAAFVTKLP